MGFFAQEELYALCGCGSGKKYKFCCFGREREGRRQSASPQTSSRWGPSRGLEGVFVLDLEGFEELSARGVSLMETGKPREAMPYLKKAARLAPRLACPHNNLALAHYASGEIEEALRICERVDRDIEPGNSFTLASLVHYYLLLGKREAAESKAARLLGSRPLETSAAGKRCEALARLGWHEKVLQAARQLPEPIDPGDPTLAYYAGVALANLGRGEEAQQRLRIAVSDSFHGDRARLFGERLQRGAPGPGLEGGWPYFGFGGWTPLELIGKLGGDGKGLRRCPGLAEAFLAMLEETEEHREEALTLLKLLGTPRAIEILRKVAFGTFGSDALRTCALTHLRTLGELPNKSRQRVWMEREWREVSLAGIEITSEARSWTPPELFGSMRELCEALREQRYEDAERLGRSMLEKAPDCPAICHNLAMAILGLGKEEECEAFLRRAMELDPSYIHAAAVLADSRLRKGRLDEARELIAQVASPERAHPQAYAALLVVQARLAVVEGRLENAAHALDTAESIWPEAVETGWGAEGLRLLSPWRKRSKSRDGVSPRAGDDETGQKGRFSQV